MKQVRQAAADILCSVENDKAYSGLLLNDVIKKAQLADARDVTLLSALVYGVLERRITLDYNLFIYMDKKAKKLHPRVLALLRIGAYQILYMEKIPVSAAVNESVNIAKKSGLTFATGLINAVLRKVAVNGLLLPEQSDNLRFLSVKYSVPEELISHYARDYGMQNTLKILSASNGRRPVFIRTNTLITTDELLCAELNGEGVKTEMFSVEHCISVENTGDITALSAFKKGMFHVQDMSSQLCCKLLNVYPGCTVADCCASPGGKSFTLAQYMNNSGSILACDMYEHRTRLIESGAERLSVTCIKTVCCDALTLYESYGGFDRVLCDVPCSGLGVIGRKPEIRYKSLDEINALPPIQSKLLESCSRLVKPGGALIYSTCTLNKAENDNICDAFLAEHPEFSVSDDKDYSERCTGRYITVFPEENGGDGFFTAKLIRNK